MEDKYIEFMRSLLTSATLSYKTKYKKLKEGVWVCYFKKPDTFGKSHGKHVVRTRTNSEDTQVRLRWANVQVVRETSEAYVPC